MRQAELVAAYLPSTVVSFLCNHDTPSSAPMRQSFSTVCMFADVSGFTALSEKMARYGPEGAEYLAKHLNSYFSQMVKIIASMGGDIFKFAGDAMLVLWPDDSDMSLEERVQRAGQCALEIQLNLHKAELQDGVTLSVKIGIGVGEVSVLHMGGVLRRMEYVAVGEPLVQAFGAEHHCEAGGDVVLSPGAWALASSAFKTVATMDDGAVQIAKDGRGDCLTPKKKVSINNMLRGSRLDEAGDEVEKRLRNYVAGAILPWINPDSLEQEVWGSDLRNVTVLFVNLGLKDMDMLAASKYDDAMVKMHDVLRAAQSAVYQYEGAVNKFLNDDKGSTLIAVFGLPPLCHEDDATRGVMCGLAICERLWSLGLIASVGITTGVVFCGVVGSTTRKEYTILGDTVNLSARLMQRAGQIGGGVLCDLQIRRASSQGVAFQELDTINVKGKTVPIRIFRPYPSGLMRFLPPRAAPGSEPSYLRMAYEAQQLGIKVNRLLRPLELPPPISGDGVKDPGETEAAQNSAASSTGAGAPTPHSARNSATGARRTTQFWAPNTPRTGSTGATTPGSSVSSASVKVDHVLTVEEVFGTAHVAASGGSTDGDAAVDDEGFPVADLYAVNRKVKESLSPSATPALGTGKARPPSVSSSNGPGGKRGSDGARRGSGNSHLTRPDIPLSKLRCLLTKSPAPLSASNAAFRGAPTIHNIKLMVPKGLETEDALDVRVSYDSVDSSSVPDLVSVVVPDDDDPASVNAPLLRENTLAGIRDSAVSAAKKNGMLHADAQAADFLLRIAGSDALVPVTDKLGGLALWQFVAESGATLTEEAISPANTLNVQLVRARDCNVLQSRQAQAMQLLIEGKLMLNSLRQGGCTLIEGEFGLGKTAIVARFVGDIVGGSATVFCGAGSPFTRNSPYSVWADVLQQFLKEYRDCKSLVACTDAALEILRIHAATLEPYFGLLNSVLQLELPGVDTALESTLKPRQKDKLIRGLLLALIRGVAADAPALIVLDDGVYMHRASWGLAYDVSIAASLPAGAPGALPLMLVISTRPITHYLDIVAPEAPAGYYKLVDSPSVNTVRLSRVSQAETALILAAAAKWGGLVSQDVITLIEGKTHGNPSMIQEVVLSLIARGRLMHTELAPGAPTSALTPTHLLRIVNMQTKALSATARSTDSKLARPLSTLAPAASFRELLSSGQIAPPSGIRPVRHLPSHSKGLELGAIGEESSDGSERKITSTTPPSEPAIGSNALMVSAAAVAAGAGIARIGVGWASITGPLGPLAGLVARKHQLLGVDPATNTATAALTLTDGLAATHVPYCRRSHWSISTRIDRLKLMEQLVLKVGSLIGKQMRNTLAAVSVANTASSPLIFMPAAAHDAPAPGGAGSTGVSKRRLTVGSGGKAVAAAMASSAGTSASGDRFTITFRFNILVECFPLEILRDPRELAAICVNLERQGVITHGFARGQPNSPTFAESVFTINSGFMPDTVRFRMLAEQRKGVEKKIKDCIDRYEDALRKNIMSKMLTAMAASSGPASGTGAAASSGSSAMQPQRSSWMRVRKNPDTASAMSFFTRGSVKKEWKVRWLVLTQETLSMYKDSENIGRGAKPVQVITLKTASASLMSGSNLTSTMGEEHVLKIDARQWEKKGKVNSSLRSFYVAANSHADADDWLLWIRTTIGYLNEQPTPKKAPRPDHMRLTDESGAGAAGSVSASSEDAGEVVLTPAAQAKALIDMFAPSPSGFSLIGNRILVTVEEAQRLVPAKLSGVPMIFVTLCLDEGTLSTLPSHGTLDPIWGTTLGFPVNVEQAAKGLIKVFVWDRDNEGTDHLIGWTQLKASDLPMTVQDSSVPVSGAEKTMQDPGSDIELKLHSHRGLVSPVPNVRAFGLVQEEDATLAPDAGILILKARIFLSPSAATECTALRSSSATTVGSRSTSGERRASDVSLPLVEERFTWVELTPAQRMSALEEAGITGIYSRRSSCATTDSTVSMPLSAAIEPAPKAALAPTPPTRPRLRPLVMENGAENGTSADLPLNGTPPEHRSGDIPRSVRGSQARVFSPTLPPRRNSSLLQMLAATQPSSSDHKGSVSMAVATSRRSSVSSSGNDTPHPSGTAEFADRLLALIDFFRTEATGELAPQGVDGERKSASRMHSGRSAKHAQSNARLMRSRSGDALPTSARSHDSSGPKFPSTPGGTILVDLEGNAELSDSCDEDDVFARDNSLSSPQLIGAAGLPMLPLNFPTKGEVRLQASQLAEVCGVLSAIADSLQHGAFSTSENSAEPDGSATLAVAAMKAMDVDAQNQKWLTTEYMKPAPPVGKVEGPRAAILKRMSTVSSLNTTPIAREPVPAAIPPLAIAPKAADPPKPTPAPAVPAPAVSPAAASVLSAVSDNKITLAFDARTQQLPGDLIAGPGSGTCSDGWLGWGINHLGPLGTDAEAGTTTKKVAVDALLADEQAFMVTVTNAELRQRQRNTDMFDCIYYEDAEDNMHGPFTASLLAEWVAGGDLPADSGVRMGSPKEEPIPIGGILPQLNLRNALEKAKKLAELGGNLDSWGFDIFATEASAPAELIPIPIAIFLRLRLPRFFTIPEAAFTSFVEDVCAHMNLHPKTTPYHNFFHAVDVMQCANSMLTHMNAGRIFTPVETLAFVLGALTHDLEHPGFNNLYLINSHHELAIRYNDNSVLENHHASVAFQLLRLHAVLDKLSRAQYKDVRKMMVAVILATDMTCHFSLTDELKSVGFANASRLSFMLAMQPTFSSFYSATGVDDESTTISTALPEGDSSDISAADRLVMLKNFVHAADISNPTKPWSVCKKWSDLVLQEFFQQGDREKAESLPISPNTDRSTTKQAQLSMNFIDFVVAPLYIAISTLLPKMQQCVENINSNRKTWSDLLTGEIETAAGASAVQKEEEKKKWARRNTAFTEVMMPIVQEASGKETSGDVHADAEIVQTARVLSLNALETFAAAASASSDVRTTARRSFIIPSTASALSSTAALSHLEGVGEVDELTTQRSAVE